MQQRTISWTALAAFLAITGATSALAAEVDKNSTRNVSARDKVFLENAIRGDNSEIALGKIAAKRGGSQGIKDFGQALVTDHTQGKQDAEGVADQVGVHKTDGITSEARREERKLQRLSGRAFDHEFARYMVRDHKEDLAEFQRMANHKNGGPIVDFAQKTVPVLQKHLQMAESLQKNPNATGALGNTQPTSTPTTAAPVQAAPSALPTTPPMPNRPTNVPR